MNWKLKTVLVLVFVGLVYFLNSENHVEDLSGKLAPGNVVVMYSLTTCPYCRATRAMLTRARIPFTEYFMDEDEASSRKFQEILAASGAPPGAVGTPSLVVNDMLLLNNPDFEMITSHLRYIGG
jgi:glutaredoxin